VKYWAGSQPSIQKGERFGLLTHTATIQLEIAHVLFIDIVGYSKLSINDQHAAVEELNQIVRASEQFQKAEEANRIQNWPPARVRGMLAY